MTSLSEVYEGGRGGPNLRRLYLGVGLFLVGVVLTVSGITVGASAAVADALSLGAYEARELAGIAGGIGLPVTVLGVVTVLPQSGFRVRATAFVGTAISLFGVVLFWTVYPQNWYGLQPDYTLPVVAVYFLGALTTMWALFTAVANFKTRNDPGGTVKLEITKQGQTRVVEVSNDDLRSRLSGIGFLGSTPDGSVDTQTAGQHGHGGTHPAQRNAPGTTVSDGGATTDDAEFLDEPNPTPKGDVYCGNCAHFKYVRTNAGMQPYCGLHGEVMDDMDPCQRWEANTDGGATRDANRPSPDRYR